ncbi:hypothetical protein BI343_11860 [Chromobacterium amazonense]|uniref:hypothetical protein n=1 Tax=Chromobacterium amazonense TaxID=1382803 RepID=UPI0008D922A2|nr:hypothetical protein [Chromobacterium amazonense]MDE1715496.1 hypothetical protein [Chromobacterium amazonense]OHX17495.1 hypothetical protein BI343_11860 [Chromobacterium amazonense]
MILVTSGADFISDNFVLDWLEGRDETIVNLDTLTYAGNLETLRSVMYDPRHIFAHGSIDNRAPVGRLPTEVIYKINNYYAPPLINSEFLQ